jgi:hypothetical protein
MEKGLHGFQTITDGCAFNLNKVLFPRRDRENGKITGEGAVAVYAKVDEGLKNYPRNTLGGVDYIDILPIKIHNEQKEKEEWKGVLVLYEGKKSTVLSHKKTQRWLDTKVAEHLRTFSLMLMSYISLLKTFMGIRGLVSLSLKLKVFITTQLSTALPIMF